MYPVWDAPAVGMLRENIRDAVITLPGVTDVIVEEGCICSGREI